MDRRQMFFPVFLLVFVLARPISGQTDAPKSSEDKSLAKTLRWKLQTGDILSVEMSRIDGSTPRATRENSPTSSN